MDSSDSDENGSSHKEDIDLSDIEENSPSNAENMNASSPETSGSSLPEDIGSSDAEDMDLSDDEKSSASSVASSVIENLRFSGPARRQNWSLPDTIIFYMAKNPSTPKLYQNLIQSCKYFFLINPIVISSGLELRRGKIDKNNDANSEDGNDEETNDEGAAVKVTGDYWKIEQYFIKKNGFYKKANKKIDLKNYSAKIWNDKSNDSGNSNFWMHNYVTNKNIVTSIISKIYRCNFYNLQLRHQNLSLAEFSFLATSAVNIWLDKSTIKYDDGTVVPIEKIVECATKATLFQIELDDNDASISTETVKNFLQIPHFSNIEIFRLGSIPDSFDIETLFAYLKRHKRTLFCPGFSDSISAAYKKRLEAIVDEVTEAGGRGGYKSPLIVFPGLDNEKFEKLYEYHQEQIDNDL